jgi:hypothetical protein
LPRPNQFTEPSICTCGKPATRRVMVSVYGKSPDRRMVSGTVIKLCEDCFKPKRVKSHVQRSLLAAFAEAVTNHSTLPRLD